MAALFALGGWMLVGEEEDEAEKCPHSSPTGGWALFVLGLSISLDELAMGAQPFLFAQLGLRLGSRLSKAARESAENIAGLALIGLGVLVLFQTVA